MISSKRTIKSLSALFIAISFAFAGNALVVGSMGVILKEREVGQFIIGVIGACFFIGASISTISAHILLAKIGHIRAFGLFCAVFAISIICHSLSQNLFLWIFLRLMLGYCYYAILMSIESWINQKAKNAVRSRVLSFYEVVFYLSFGCGLLLIGLPFSENLKLGDYAGIGCMVNSCGECEACKASNEQFCLNAKTVFTYNSKDVFHGDEITYGGYSNNYVVSEKFAIKVPKSAQIEKVAPLLCAGITTYSPIMFSKVKKGQKVAVAGVGGLGHLAVKYMVALGAEVTGFDIVDKREAVLGLGAKRFINVNSKEFGTITNEFDFIISMIPYHYDINAYQKMLKLGGEMAIVCLPSYKNNPKLDRLRILIRIIQA